MRADSDRSDVAGEVGAAGPEPGAIDSNPFPGVRF